MTHPLPANGTPDLQGTGASIASGEVAERAAKAMIELEGYLDRHLDRLVCHGRESPLHRLVLDGRLNREQVIGILKLVVVGGTSR